MKNAQFWPNLPMIQAILPTHLKFILAKIHKDKLRIEDFFIITYFGASVIFFVTVSKFEKKTILKGQSAERNFQASISL